MDIPRIFPVISHLALFGASTSTRWWTHVLQAALPPALPEAALPAAASPWSFKRMGYACTLVDEVVREWDDS